MKHLSTKQDNKKNQIYLVGGLDAVTNLFPATIEVRSASHSLTKTSSAAEKPKLGARLDFAWLTFNGDRHDAPHTRKLLSVSRSAHVRISQRLPSGAGCASAPSARRLRPAKQSGTPDPV